MDNNGMKLEVGTNLFYLAGAHQHELPGFSADRVYGIQEIEEYTPENVPEAPYNLYKIVDDQGETQTFLEGEVDFWFTGG